MKSPSATPASPGDHFSFSFVLPGFSFACANANRDDGFSLIFYTKIVY